jgi:hypothetical protein
MIAATIKFLLKFFYLFRQTSLKGLSFRDQKHVVWLNIFQIRSFFSDELVQTCGLLNGLSANGILYNVRIGKSIGKVRDKKVYFICSRYYDAYGFSDYAATIKYITSQLEAQGCEVLPSSHEAEYWENKTFMHRKFEELKISTPRTMAFSTLEDLLKQQLSFPVLIKEEHSCSSIGVHKVESKDALSRLVDREFFLRNKNILVQELLNMRRDLRVILVGDKIVLHYWRINTGKEWKPTSTSHGSDVDFVTFPEQWRSFIVDQFQRLGLRTGAFDIAWQNDDLSTVPLILEVSPHYQPNPPVDLSKSSLSYGQYKKKLLFRNGYLKNFIDIVFKIVDQQIKLTLKKS